MLKIVKYVLYDILRNRIVLGYALFLLVVSLLFVGTEENVSKGLLSLLSLVLIVLPLVGIIFTTIHFYNAYEFIELLLAQPLPRRRILLSEYAGISLALLLAYWIGVGIPVLAFAWGATAFALLFTGSALTLIFVSLAFLAAVLTRDKARGIGIALLLWFYFVILYDGLVLMLLFSFSDYPVEKATLFFTTLNPVDLGRIFIMLQMDVSALMGYTSALYRDFFGSKLGMLYTALIMTVWVVLPLFLSVRIFNRRDL